MSMKSILSFRRLIMNKSVRKGGGCNAKRF